MDEAVEGISHPRTMVLLCLSCPGGGEAQWFEGTHRGHGDYKSRFSSKALVIILLGLSGEARVRRKIQCV